MMHLTKAKWIEYFNYLDDLRDSGETNMYGARSYLLEQFEELDKQTAGNVLTTWMKTFGNGPVEERVEKII